MSASSQNQLETRELTSKTRKEKGRKEETKEEGRGREGRRREETASLVHNAMPETVEASIPEQSSQAISIDKRI